MRKLLRCHGMTLLEAVIVASMGAILIAALTILFSKGRVFVRQSSVRQSLMRDARSCADTIQQMLGNGKASSVIISTHDEPGGADFPNSQINFVFRTPLQSGTTAYMIYLEAGTVYTREFNPAGAKQPVTLASNVSGLIFSCDSKDPGLVNVSLQMDAATGHASDSNRATTILLPNQLVHMTE